MTSKVRDGAGNAAGPSGSLGSMPRLSVAVVGSRGFANKYLMGMWLTAHMPAVHIISGGARGPDTWAIDWAQLTGVPYTIYPADWDRYGKRAGFLRNTTLVEKADWIVAFWDGKSRGTLDTIRKAHEAGKRVTVVFASGKVRDNGR